MGNLEGEMKREQEAERGEGIQMDKCRIDKALKRERGSIREKLR